VVDSGLLGLVRSVLWRVVWRGGGTIFMLWMYSIIPMPSPNPLLGSQ
jgi:hypothetical protein